jgi:hypothetical protein
MWKTKNLIQSEKKYAYSVGQLLDGVVSWWEYVHVRREDGNTRIIPLQFSSSAK